MLVMVSVKHSEPPSKEEWLKPGVLYKATCGCCAVAIRMDKPSSDTKDLFLGNAYGGITGVTFYLPVFNPGTVVSLTQE